MAVSELARVTGQASLDRLLWRLGDRRARIGVVGLRQMGPPISVEYVRQFDVVGFDTNPQEVAGRERGLVDCDAIIISVLAPLDTGDVSYAKDVAHLVAEVLGRGQLVVLDLATYPGMTDEMQLPLFQKGGLELVKDFLLAFSPGRTDLGSTRFKILEIPKVVGAISPAGDVKSATPVHIVQLAARALKERNKSLRRSRVLVVGIAIPILDRLRAQGANVAYHDPLVSSVDIDLREWPESRSRQVANVAQRRRRSDYSSERRRNDPDVSRPALQVERRYAGSQRYARRCDDGLQSVELTERELARADCVIIASAHAAADYGLIARTADIIIDTRNTFNDVQRRSAAGLVVRL